MASCSNTAMQSTRLHDTAWGNHLVYSPPSLRVSSHAAAELRWLRYLLLQAQHDGPRPRACPDTLFSSHDSENPTAHFVLNESVNRALDWSGQLIARNGSALCAPTLHSFAGSRLMLAPIETAMEGGHMYKRMLVALDGSATAESVLPYALGISRAAQSQLTLVRVVDDDSQRAEAASYVDGLAARLNAEGRCISAEGDVASALVKEAAQVPGTLVAMTTHGRSGVMGVLLGSVAMKVLRGGPDPVLIYRPHEASAADPTEPIRLSRVVLPLDASASANTIGEQAAEFARLLGAELVVISVLNPRALAATGAPTGDLLESSYVHGRASDLGRQFGVKFSWEVLHGNQPAQAIADFVGDDRNTMLAMVTRANAAPVAAALLGSVTTDCLRKTGVPILMRLQ